LQVRLIEHQMDLEWEKVLIVCLCDVVSVSAVVPASVDDGAIEYIAQIDANAGRLESYECSFTC
jgi:hypothetical protein